MLDICNLQLGVRLIYGIFRSAVRDMGSYKAADTQAKPCP